MALLYAGAMPVSTLLPDDSARWQQAEALVAADRLDEAAELYRTMPDSRELAAPAAMRLSQIASRQGRLRDAVAAGLAAFEARVPEPELLRSVAQLLEPLGELRAMYACAHDLSVLRGRNHAAMRDLGALLSGAGFHADGLQLLERARAAGANGLPVLLPLARTLQALGRIPEARAAYLACLKADPRLAIAWLRLAELGARDVKTDTARAGAVQELLGFRGDNDALGAMLHYALFRLRDRSGDTDAAWTALDEGMRLQRVVFAGYAPAIEGALLDHLATLRAGDPGESLPEGPGAEGPVPVFLVGLHAPTVAALGKLLARHPQVGDLGETGTFVQQLRWCADAVGPPQLDLELAQRASRVDFATLGERYAAHTAWRAPHKAVLLDRTPANFANVAWIARALPRARILHVAAAPMDTCFAAISAWTGTSMPWSHGQVEVADHYRGYRRLMAHWRNQFPGRMLDVRQDELLADPAAVLGDVLRFCGLDAGAVPELAAGAGAMAEGDAAPQRWRRYEAQLESLRARLGALAY
jgi:tetratricopeptide (TPR) repeat protein